MTALPLVERELRLAARNRGMQRVRWWAALLAMGVGVLSLGVLAMSRGGSRLGNPFFQILSGYALGLCLLAGIGFTADALSSERRDGTLGLLFLTDLKGYDVVLGKFVPAFLCALYLLLALLPIVALPMVFGGVTGGEFWRRALALINALFVSLAAGILVSAFHRHTQRAMLAALALVLVLAAGVPGIISLAQQAHFRNWFVPLRWLSPLYPYTYSADTLYARHRDDYWGPLLGSALLALMFLLVASTALPRLWREGSVAYRWAGGAGLIGQIRHRLRERARPQRELLLKNPICWLMRIESGIAWAAWGVALAWGISVVGTSLANPSSATPVMLTHYGVRPFGFAFKVLFALQACKFFSEGRRTGSLELLLCTPLTDREIVNGVALGLWRIFCWPLVVFLGLLFLPFGLGMISAFSSGRFEPGLEALGGLILGGAYTLQMLMDLLALCWFGMAMALSRKKPQHASALTILYVLVLPAVLSACFLDIVPDVFFIAFGMAKTRTDLRRVLVQQYGQN